MPIPKSDNAVSTSFVLRLCTLYALTCLGNNESLVCVFFLYRPEYYNRDRVGRNEYAEIFGKDNFFLEIQNHGLAEEDEVRNALIKISEDPDVLEAANKSTAHMYISNPLKEKKSDLWSTHPAIEKRIEALRNIN